MVNSNTDRIQVSDDLVRSRAGRRMLEVPNFKGLVGGWTKSERKSKLWRSTTECIAMQFARPVSKTLCRSSQVRCLSEAARHRPVMNLGEKVSK
jgi:hypothetical protein